MANSFDLSHEQKDVLADILKQDGADFSVLVGVAGLDPSVDFRGADLRDVDFGYSDLDGYDFSDADLRGCRFDRARIKGAIFANNRDEDTVWPRSHSDRGSARPVLRATTDFELRSFQRDAISTIVAALERGVERPIVLMPPGTGRTFLLEALLSELGNRDMVGVALIFTPTKAVVEYLRHRFSDSFGPDAVASSIQTPPHARLIVAHLPSRDPGAARRSYYIRSFNEVSHIFILDGALSPRVLHNVQSHYPGVPIVIFGDPSVTEKTRRMSLNQEGEIVFSLSYNQAVSDGFLDLAKIHNHGSRYSVENSEKKDVEYMVSQVLDVVSRMPSGATGGVVCRNINRVREMASGLSDGIDNNRWGHNGIQRVVQHTSPSADKSLVQAALDLPGTLLLMTDSVASDFDWAVLDYVIVLTRLRSPERLAYYPHRRDRQKSMQVFDYLGNFDWMQELLWE